MGDGAKCFNTILSSYKRTVILQCGFPSDLDAHGLAKSAINLFSSSSSSSSFSSSSSSFSPSSSFFFFYFFFFFPSFSFSSSLPFLVLDFPFCHFIHSITVTCIYSITKNVKPIKFLQVFNTVSKKKKKKSSRNILTVFSKLLYFQYCTHH